MVAETLEILVSHLSNHAYSIAFPEFSAPVSFSLQQFSRSTKISRLQKQLKHFLDKVECFSLVLFLRDRTGCMNVLERRGEEINRIYCPLNFFVCVCCISPLHLCFSF